MMFYQLFLLPQVKRCAIIIYKHVTYKLYHKLPNHLRFRELGNIGKVFKLHRIKTQRPIHSPTPKLTPRQHSKKTPKNRNFPAVCYSTRKLEPDPNIPRPIVERRHEDQKSSEEHFDRRLNE